MKNFGFALLLVLAFGLVACCPGCDWASSDEPATDEPATEEVQNEVENEVEVPDTENEVEVPDTENAVEETVNEVIGDLTK